MDEGSSYCDSSGEIRSVSDAAKIANVVMTGAVDEICLKKDSAETNLKPRFLADRLGVMGLVVGMERERG